MPRAAAAADVFTAIADPTRRRLLARLGAREHSVRELTEGAGMSLAAISLHLQVLHAAGLVSRRAVGRRRLYRLAPGPLREVTDWLAGLRAFWDDRLDRLETLVEDVHASTRGPEADRTQD